MSETPSLLNEKYGANTSELAQNNLYVHGTTKPKLLRTDQNRGGIIETGLRNGVSVSEDTLARNMMYSTAVRYGGSGIDGVLIFYDPPKGALQLDDKEFPPSTTKLNNYGLDETLGAEHIAFWLETSKSGIQKYVEEALSVMLENLESNEDIIGAFVDELAQLLVEHALVPNTTAATEFTEESIDKTHSRLDIDTATTRACEILWNAFSETLFAEISNLNFYTRELSNIMEDEKEKQHLFMLLTGQEKEVGTILKKTEYVGNFIKLWKKYKDIQLLYDPLEKEVHARISYFRDKAARLEILLTSMLNEVEDYKIKEAKKANSLLSKLKRTIRNGLLAKKN